MFMNKTIIGSETVTVHKKRRDLTRWYFIMPCLLFMLYFAIVPTIYVIQMSFMKYQVLMPDIPPRFAGLRNFIRVMSSPEFYNSLRVSFWLSITGPIVQAIAGLGLAILLNTIARGRRIIMTIMLIPMLVAPAIGAFIFKTLYDYQWGPLNYILRIIGIGRIRWVSDPDLALFSLWLFHFWVATPFMMVLMAAGLSSLPQEIYESAALQSRSGWQTFIHITLPLMKPYIILALILKFIDSFQGFADAYIITKGGPGTSTESVPFLTFRMTLVGFDVTSASALSIIQLIIILAVVFTFIRTIGIKTGQQKANV
ncbi:MAG: sugar ABC transporter permease [Spirochaetota bacterium]|nr:MAG: sugar ABC transporter permease [Spirochaetota bacterium]